MDSLWIFCAVYVHSFALTMSPLRSILFGSYTLVCVCVVVRVCSTKSHTNSRRALLCPLLCPRPALRAPSTQTMFVRPLLFLAVAASAAPVPVDVYTHTW